MKSKSYLLAGTMLPSFALWQPTPVQSAQEGSPLVVAQQTKEESRERRGGRPEGQQRPARQERQEQRQGQPQRPAAQQQQQQQQQQRPAAQQPQQKPQPQQSGRPGASSGRPAAQEQRQERREQRREVQEQKQQRPEQRPAAQDRRQERQEQRRDAREQKPEQRDQRRDVREQKQEQPQRSFGQPQRPGIAPSAPSSDPQRREAGEDRRDRRDGDRRETVRERLDRDGPRRIDAVRQQRREERRGDRVVINEPGGRTIIRENNGRVIIRHDETRRFSAFGRVRTERRGNDRVSIVARPGGVEIVSVYDDSGRLIRRVRRVGGREFVLINNRPRGRVVTDFYVRLAPPRLSIPRERYIVAAAVAAPALIFATLTAAPVEALERSYTLEEIRYSEPVRARMPRVDLDSVTFETGSWELTPDQVSRLSVIADAMIKAIEKNPQEVFMIEGHTDAVGDDVDNLSLSDRRAETVALILTEEFKVPPENLVTQGYGEQHLKVDTQGPEEQNRRVTVLRITPLLAQEGNTAAARPGDTRKQ